MAMRIKKASEYSEFNLTVRAYIEKIESGDITFDIDIQRPYVWKDAEQKSLLIQSLIINDIIPPFIFNKVDDVYEAMDCKQRSLTIQKFLNDEFALKDVMTIEIINDNGELEELDINGLKYSELPEFIQNAIKDCNIKIWYLSNADQEQVARNFCNLNNGKIINAATLNRVKAKSKEQINRLGKHKVFEEALSKIALDGHVNEDMAVKAYAILNNENVSTDTKWIRPYMRDVDITRDDETLLEKIFNRIFNIHSLIEDKKIAKRVYTRTHMISIVPVIAQSLNDGLADEEMMEWFVNFFSGKKSPTISKKYNEAAGRGTGKNSAIRIRLNELGKSYEKFLEQRNDTQLMQKDNDIEEDVNDMQYMQ